MVALVEAVATFGAGLCLVAAGLLLHRDADVGPCSG